MGSVDHVVRESSLTRQWLIRQLGIGRSRYYDWLTRTGMPNRHNGNIPRSHWILSEEREAIIRYCRDKVEDGYRRLTYMMLDEDIVAVSPATTYRVLKAANLLNRWLTRGASTKGDGFLQPTERNEHWHIDIMYANILGTFFFLICLLDGYSRMILHHELRAHMTEYDVEITVQRARERHPERNPTLISDNAKQFLSKDFQEFLRSAGLNHIRTSVAYPQSNGKLERFHGTIRQESIRRSSYVTIADARGQIADYIRYYNEERLHSSIYYLTPKEVFEGKTEVRLAERQRKLDDARRRRMERSTLQVAVTNL
ncbi:MAG: IS3 family transposase [Gammaproteobacteria bacterium]|nr:IS3 family transposase [Gammaproteobacteria bacterium]